MKTMKFNRLKKIIKNKLKKDKQRKNTKCLWLPPGSVLGMSLFFKLYPRNT